jgi:hypothetical protein
VVDYNAAVPRLSTEKIIGLTVVIAAVFVVGMLLLVDHVTRSAREKAEAKVSAEVAVKESQQRGPSLLQGAGDVASPFVRHVGAGRFADAYALLAAPYRRAVKVSDFAQACRASPILTGARSVTLSRLRQQNAGGATSIEASGVLDSAAGAVPIGFVFLQEQGQLRILVVSLAGVPVLQGVAPPR